MLGWLCKVGALPIMELAQRWLWASVWGHLPGSGVQEKPDSCPLPRLLGTKVS